MDDGCRRWRNCLGFCDRSWERVSVGMMPMVVCLKDESREQSYSITRIKDERSDGCGYMTGTG